MAYPKSLIDRISESYKFLNNIAIKYSFFLTVIYALITLCIVVWTLDKGLVFFDEAWYLLHMKNLSYISTSEWPAYAKLFFPVDLLKIRYLTFSLFILSGLFISLGMSRFYKQISIITLLPVTLTGLFLLWSPVQFVPNYITFNIFIFYTGLGCYLLMLSSKSVFLKYLWGICTGFVFGQLFFIMITNTPYLALLFGSIFFLKPHKQYLMHYWVAMIIGTLFAGVFFFSIFKSIDHYLTDINLVFSYLNLGESHGIMAIISWVKDTGLYFAKEIIIPSFLLFFIIAKTKTTRLTNFFAALSFAGYIAYLFSINFFIDSFNITTPSPIYILAGFLLIMFIENREWQSFVLIVLLLFIPFFASMGTNVSFNVRSTLYLTPLILFLFILIRRDDLSRLTLVFHVILLFALIRFSTEFILKPGWQGYVINNQKTELASIGIDVNIKLDKNKIEEVKELKALIPSHSLALINSPDFWGFIYLLELNVPYYYFRFSEVGWDNYNSKRIKNLTVLYLIEDLSQPFPESIKTNPDIRTIDTIPLQIIKKTNLYKITYR